MESVDHEVVENGRRLHPQVALWLSRAALCAFALGIGAIVYRAPPNPTSDSSAALSRYVPAVGTSKGEPNPGVMAASFASTAGAAVSAATKLSPEHPRAHARDQDEAEKRSAPLKPAANAAAPSSDAKPDHAARKGRTARSTRASRPHQFRPVTAAVRGVRKLGRAVGRLF